MSADSEEFLTPEAMAEVETDAGLFAAPDGFDPEATAVERLPEGRHLCRILTYRIKQDNEWKFNDVIVERNGQIRPTLECVEGPHKGKTIMDFLPFPIARFVDARLANQFGNFVRAFGFGGTAGAIVSAGWHPNDLLQEDRVAWVAVEGKFNKDGSQKLYQGRQEMRVKMFGYESKDAPKKAAPNSKPTAPGDRSKSAEPTPTAAPGRPTPPAGRRVKI